MEWLLLLGGAALVYFLNQSSSTTTSAPPAPVYSSTTVVPDVAAPASSSYQAGPVSGPAPAGPISRAQMLAQHGITASVIGHGGATIGQYPSLAAAVAFWTPRMAAQGFRYVAGNPTQAGTFTVSDAGPAASGTGRWYQLEWAQSATAPAPDVFVPPGS